jgi:uncharacterized protein (TIGR03118 family)
MLRWARRSVKHPRRSRAIHRYGFAPTVEALDERCLLSAGYFQSNLISDVPGLAQFTDSKLVNPWGLSLGQTGPFWFSDNSTGVSTLNTNDGSALTGMPPLVAAVPGLPGEPGGLGSPTGTVFNGGSGFLVSQGGQSGSSVFLFATEEGTIAGWSPGVNMIQAVTAVNESQTPGRGPVYTGLTLASNADGTFLYAANFRADAIDVFNQDFQAVQWQGAFEDPSLPAGFVPFNVQAIGADIFVTYTEQNDGRYDHGTGPGNGYIDQYDTSGHLLGRLISQGPLNSPWGIAVAPSNFGEFQGDLLVGNFGDGRINAFNPQSGAFLGSVTDAAGQPMTIPGLWGLSFGNNGDAGAANALYFTAGVGNEYHGLFGSVAPDSPDAASNAVTNSESRLLNAIESSDQGDAYPLPPTVGPSLQPPAATVAYLTLQDGTLALVPTLSAATGARESGANNAAALVASGQGLVPVVASVGNAETDGSLLQGLLGRAELSNQQTPLGGPSPLELFAGQPTTRLSQPASPGDFRENTGIATNADTEVSDPETIRAELAQAYDVQFPSHPSFSTDRSDRKIAVASVGRSLEWNGFHDGRLLKLCQCLFLGLVAGCGIRYLQVKRKPLSQATIGTLKSIWTRITGQSASTMRDNSGRVAAVELLSTQVFNVVPHDWERNGLTS